MDIIFFIALGIFAIGFLFGVMVGGLYG